MRLLNKFFLFACLSMIGLGAFAGKNPISWSLNQSFPNEILSGVSYSMTYTLTNQLPLKLVHPLVILRSASPSSEFAYQDNCTGQRLAPKQSCTVTVSVQALVTGLKYVRISIAGYDHNVVPLPEVVTMATSTIAGGVVGSVIPRLPRSMTAGSSADFTFQFINHSDTNATGVNASVLPTTGVVTISSNTCTGTLVANGGFCMVSGRYVPSSSPSFQTVAVSLTYSGPTGSPVTPSTSTTVNAADAPIVGSVLQGLPGLMQAGQQYTVKFLFSNTTSSTTFTLLPIPTPRSGQVTCTDGGSPVPCTPFIATQSCTTAPTLEGNSQCELDITFTAPSATTPPSTYTLTAALQYSGTGATSPAAVSTAGAVLTTLPTTRVVKVVNHCNFDVWYSLHGAGFGSPPCPAGTSPSNGQCWFPSYPTTSTNHLVNGASDSVTLPALSVNGGQQWSGIISASLNCTSGTCQQASCNNPGGTTCAIGTGFNQPATQAEITMLVNSNDSYDVEVINGFHIPISMKPYAYISSDGMTKVAATADNYNCGTPGEYFGPPPATGNGFGTCDWNTVTASSLPSPSSYYYWVGGGSGAACTSTCTIPGEICGLSQLIPNGTITGPNCGKFLGYWSANELCGQQTNLSAAVISDLQCNRPTGFASPDFPNTFTSLMKCPVPPAPPLTPQTNPTYNTCYFTPYPPGSAVSQCCGCVNWWDQSQTGGVAIGANSGGSALTCPAGQTDPLWTANIQPLVQWMKKACPSAYVYPFDDGTSSFLCTNAGGASQANTTSYEVTFCPGNSNGGLPAGATDGR